LGTAIFLVIDLFDSQKQVNDWLKLFIGTIVAGATFLLNFIGRMILQVKNSVAREPFVGPEEFEQALNTILKDEKVNDKRAVIVFDNIDRAPKDRTEEILTGISAFFDNSKQDEPRNLIILVPFSSMENDELDDKTIQKFFDAIVPLPKLLPDDLIEFSKERLIDTGWADEAEEIAELIDLSPLNTPRQILHFLNEMISLVDLAQKLEDEKHSTEDGKHESYLPKGTITANKVFFSKILICQKIWPEFLEFAVKQYHEPKLLFNSSAIQNIPSKELGDFLHSTTNLPKRLPDTFEPYLYFKGSDAEVSIVGGTPIKFALTHRKEEEISEYLSKDPEANLKNLTELYKIIAKREKHHQRIKNATLAILDAINGDIKNEALRRVLNSTITNKKHLARDIPIPKVRNITLYTSDSVENLNTWIALDNIFREQSQLKEENRFDGFSEWRDAYLKAVVNQPNGIERAKINPKWFPTKVLVSNDIKDSFKENFPKPFATPVKSLEAFDIAITNEFSEKDGVNFENIIFVISEGLSLATDSISEGLVERFQLTSNFIAQKHTNNDLESTHIYGISRVLSAIPDSASDLAPEDTWNILNSILHSQAPLNNLISQDNNKEVLLLLATLNIKCNFNGFPNITQSMTTLLSTAKVEDFLWVSNQLSSWEWFASAWEDFPQVISNRAKDIDFLTNTLPKSTGKGATSFINNWPEYSDVNGLDGIISKLPKKSDRKVSKEDFLNIIHESPDHFGHNVRILALNLTEELGKVANSQPLLNTFFNNLDTPEDANNLIVWLKKNDTELLNQKSSEFKDFLENEPANPWTGENLSKFLIVISDKDGKPADYFSDLSDIAINRGILTCPDRNIAFETANSIIDLWKSQIKPTENLLQVFEASFNNNTQLYPEDREKLQAAIKQIRKTHGIKKKKTKETDVD
jgi:hypothetical protein